MVGFDGTLIVGLVLGVPSAVYTVIKIRDRVLPPRLTLAGFRKHSSFSNDKPTVYTAVVKRAGKVIATGCRVTIGYQGNVHRSGWRQYEYDDYPADIESSDEALLFEVKGDRILFRNDPYQRRTTVPLSHVKPNGPLMGSFQSPEITITMASDNLGVFERKEKITSIIQKSKGHFFW